MVAESIQNARSIGTPWESVKDGAGFEIDFPGTPSFNTSGDSFFMQSHYQNTAYMVFRSNSGSGSAGFQNAQEFLVFLENQFAEVGLVSIVFQEEQSFNYVGEVSYFEKNQIARFYYTESHLYMVLVKGDDLSLASPFFASIRRNELENQTEEEDEEEILKNSKFFDGKLFTGSFVQSEDFLYYIFVLDDRVQLEEIDFSYVEKENHLFCVSIKYSPKSTISSDDGVFKSGSFTLVLRNGSDGASVSVAACFSDLYQKSLFFFPLRSKIDTERTAFFIPHVQINVEEGLEFDVYNEEENKFMLIFTKA